MATDDALKGSHTDKHGDEIVGYVNPDGSGEGNWSAVQAERMTMRDPLHEPSNVVKARALGCGCMVVIGILLVMALLNWVVPAVVDFFLFNVPLGASS